MSGYSDCACPNCFDIAIVTEEGDASLCLDCQDTGCDGLGDCERDEEYEEIFEKD